MKFWPSSRYSNKVMMSSRLCKGLKCIPCSWDYHAAYQWLFLKVNYLNFPEQIIFLKSFNYVFIVEICHFSWNFRAPDTFWTRGVFTHNLFFLGICKYWICKGFFTPSFVTTEVFYWPGHVKTCLMPYANNKGVDQLAHLHSLITTFVVCCLDSMLCILAISKVSKF